MKERCEHPWQSGPRELFQSAMDALQANDAVSQRIAFLLFDVCVETTLRTYLSLPDGASSSQLKHSEKRKYAVGNFHELTAGVGLAEKGQVRDVDMHHLKFYHAIRNHLYHDGNGITVPPEHVRGYETLAATLLKQLLAIDRPGTVTKSSQQDPPLDQNAFSALKSEFPGDINQFKRLINLLVESLEPRMIYPSTIQKLAETASFGISTFPEKLQEFRVLIGSNIANVEFRSWLLNFLADDLMGDRPQVIDNTQFLMELGKDPISFYSFMIGIRLVPTGGVEMETLDNYEDISFIRQDEYSIMGVYECCLYFEKLLRGQENWSSLSDATLFERARELQGKLRSATKKLEELIQSQRVGEREKI